MTVSIPESAPEPVSKPVPDNIRIAVQYQRGNGFEIDLETQIPAKGITAVYGHSGAGKTTLLRCIAGLEHGARTELSVGADIWQSAKQKTPTHRRGLGYVFQDGQLFPHLDVQGNLDYAVRRSGNKRAGNKQSERNAIDLDAVVELLGIGHTLKQHPATLSGGERQRVAIARALASAPRLLLMDEPLASIDQQRKQQILPFLEQLHKASDIPILYVSHSAREIARLADHLLVLEQGKLIYAGDSSQAEAQRHFLLDNEQESGVIIDAVVTQRDPDWQLICGAFGGGKIWLQDCGEKIGEKIRLHILAKDVSLSTKSPDSSSVQNHFEVVIEGFENSGGAHALVRLTARDTTLAARVTRRAIHDLGLTERQQVWAQVKAAAIVR